MENKINIAELLKDCPKGMELDCAIYENLYFDSLNADYYGTINCYTLIDGIKTSITFTKYGTYNNRTGSKCVIFPKGKTTWEGFVPPCKFKDGDIIFTHTNASKGLLEDSWVSIFKEYRNNRCACYACLCLSDLELYHDKWEDELLCELCEIGENRLATEEEKAKLFKAIKDNGYKWNAETKSLEKLIQPKFKVGDKIKDKNNKIWFVVQVSDKHFSISLIPNAEGYFVPIEDQDEYELVPNKFDIATLKPFDKVLVRDSDKCIWCASFFSHIWKDKYFCVGAWYNQCIPYGNNGHLLGTTDDCDDFYKTWE